MYVVPIICIIFKNYSYEVDTLLYDSDNVVCVVCEDEFYHDYTCDDTFDG